VTIAIAWIAYRPMLGIALLVAAVASVMLLVRRGRRSQCDAEAR
jgi:asparagine N-glycosylation enzyme membrane subunit Stt3